MSYQNKKIRKTILIDEGSHKKIRALQAKLIKKKSTGISFSHLVNLLIEIGLRNYRGENLN